MQLRALALALFLVLAGSPAWAVGGWSDGDSGPAAEEMRQAQERIEAGDYAQAVSALETAVEKAPENADVWNFLGFANRKLGNYDAAATAYEKALSIDPDHLGALEYQGELFLMLDQPEKARANLERLDSLCWFGCSEYTALEQAISDYRSNRSG